ncbi:hypothetical protein HPB49_006421 [Dermacentor silvarum]|uniref:Uncharacterized protein n=1 Tax=Dermacentor silvarum TaxID=543639 RepID=A0ACB8DNG0_DERSI|nr:hypothetical protein HPB49_006421 [Dermacentor silvarum]
MNSRRRRGASAPGPRGQFRSRRFDDRGWGTPTEEVDEMFASLQGNQGVVGVVATLSDGAIIKSTLEDHYDANRYAMMAIDLSSEAKGAMGAGPRQQPSCFKVKNERHEIIITPSQSYTLIVMKHLQETLASQ